MVQFERNRYRQSVIARYCYHPIWKIKLGVLRMTNSLRLSPNFQCRKYKHYICLIAHQIVATFSSPPAWIQRFTIPNEYVMKGKNQIKRFIIVHLIFEVASNIWMSIFFFASHLITNSNAIHFFFFLNITVCTKPRTMHTYNFDNRYSTKNVISKLPHLFIMIMQLRKDISNKCREFNSPEIGFHYFISWDQSDTRYSKYSNHLPGYSFSDDPFTLKKTTYSKSRCLFLCMAAVFQDILPMFHMHIWILPSEIFIYRNIKADINSFQQNGLNQVVGSWKVFVSG